VIGGRYPYGMAQDEQPKQTTPKGLEIPVPSRDEFLRSMDKAAPQPPVEPDGESDGDDSPPNH
jgi:hypothetical protein